jgi:hypothetical protein
MLAVWSLSLAAFLGLIIYRGHLTRHEIDTVFLNDGVDDHHEQEHDEIVRRVSRIDPFLKTAGGAALVMTVAVIGIYVMQILPSVRF